MATWYRSWPETIPEGRAYVQDGLPRLLMRECNYSTVEDYQPWPTDDPGFFLLEWDIALDGESRSRFEQHALATPDRVLVAPYYKQYPRRKPKGMEWKQIHRIRQRPVNEGMKVCEAFGFGCIYMPQSALQSWFLSGAPGSAGGFTDSTFSAWYHESYGMTPIDWSVRPQHLHGD